MERVIVVGTSCAGKTTLARRIAEALDVPHVELDVVFWGPDWRECPVDKFREAVRERVEADRWVVDGNYSKVRDIVLSRATDAVWLNYSFPIVFWRALSRTCRRVFTREELFSGNRETFRVAFLSRDSILWWVVRTYRARRRLYRQLFSVGAGAGVRLTELRRLRDADELLNGIGGAESGSCADVTGGD
jgi:adenylate kinase family enzyme